MQEKSTARWSGLSGSSISMALAETVRREKRPTIAICPKENDAITIAEDTRFFNRVLGGSKNLKVLHFPARSTDMDSTQIAEMRVAGERLSVLHNLLEDPENTVVIVSVRALAQKTLPKKELLTHTDLLVVGGELEREAFAKMLARAGYERESLVEEHGSFAIRGGVIDIFPPHHEKPFRVELVGDTVESIRTFDPASQRSIDSKEEVSIIPVREILLGDNRTAELKSRLKEFADSIDITRSKRLPLEEAFEDHRYMPAMDSLLPIFYNETASLAEFVPSRALWIAVDPFSIRREREDLIQNFDRLASEFAKQQVLAYRPAELSIPIPELERRLESVEMELFDADVEKQSAGHLQNASITLLDDLKRRMLEKVRRDRPFEPLIESFKDWRADGLGVLFVAHNAASSKKLSDLISPHIPNLSVEHQPTPETFHKAIEYPVVTVGPLSQGFMDKERKMVFVTEHELFRDRKQSIAPQVPRDELLSSLSELSPGDAVVHIDFGVGIYKGMERIVAGGIANDFLHLEYAGGDKLYLPVYRLNKIQKYIGADSGKPHVDRLGNPAAWEKAKQRAEKAVAEMAQELIALYAKRQVAKGEPLTRADSSYIQFESDFPYEETRDQARTLDDVTGDLESEKPMDRLVCGDVGFGKTEIALRAAFRVAMDGKQVAVLVPTTVLAQQHFDTFQARFKNYPIRVDFLSRFKSAADQKTVVTSLKEGKIDIVVGTHRLLSKDISFKHLGLLVVDEEHRFGVKHKERIKQFRNNVHVMTLTATPIPRTLQMSMAGIRDLSVINTPPLDRKAIQTYLCRFEESVIQGAIRKELRREGQIFFVHNKIETIAAMGEFIRKLVPEVRIEIGHGQMSEDQLEKTMHRFLKKEFDLLLCTTIIESGLDIPTANTILVNRADQFGLAQLYQLRGRVGRSEREAYAYLLIPGEELISRDAMKRLKVLKRFTELGSGLKIALHDMEIRGAGNLLGPAQSGQIAAVGLELYTQLLDREVRKLKGETVKEEIEPEIQCPIPAYLSDDYVASTGERLLLYKRLSAAKSNEELENLKNEMKDRFGPFPPTAENLFEIISVKILARQMDVLTLRISSDKSSIEFADQANINLDQILKMMKTDKRISLRPDNRLVLDLGGIDDALSEVKKILQKLS